MEVHIVLKRQPGNIQVKYIMTAQKDQNQKKII